MCSRPKQAACLKHATWPTCCHCLILPRQTKDSPLLPNEEILHLIQLCVCVCACVCVLGGVKSNAERSCRASATTRLRRSRLAHRRRTSGCRQGSCIRRRQTPTECPRWPTPRESSTPSCWCGGHAFTVVAAISLSDGNLTVFPKTGSGHTCNA